MNKITFVKNVEKMLKDLQDNSFPVFSQSDTKHRVWKFVALLRNLFTPPGIMHQMPGIYRKMYSGYFQNFTKV